MKRSLWMAFFMLVLGTGWLGTTAWSQQEVPANADRPKDNPGFRESPVADPHTISPLSEAGEPQNDDSAPDRVTGKYGGMRVVLQRNPQPNLDREFFNLVQKLKAASNDQAKGAVITQIRTLLETAFDVDLKRREKEVSEIEGRVRKLREQIEKRKKAKEDIITLRLKTIANEVDGLGFPMLNGAGNMRDGSSFGRMQSVRPGSKRGKAGIGGGIPVFDSSEFESR